jgi:hypothetical protein
MQEVKKIYELDDFLMFAKYRGKNTTLQNAIDRDIGYIDWMINQGVIEMSNTAYDYYTKAKERE